MADQQDGQQQSRSQLASTWPDPPPFWKDFTAGNVKAFGKLAEETPGGTRAEDGSVRRIENVPDGLVNLQPPPEPADGRWRVFGDQYSLGDKLPTLEDQGIRRLASPGPPQTQTQSQDHQHHQQQHQPTHETKHLDRAFELKRLSKSLLLNFLELLGIMSIDPAQANAKIDALRTLFINFHHILNEYRPHQARESLIAMMQDRLDRTRAETAAIRAAVDRARREIDGLASIKIPEPLPPLWMTPGDEAGVLKDGAAAREAELWGGVDALFA